MALLFLKDRAEAEAALLGDAWHPRTLAQAMKPQSSLNSAAQPKSKVAAAAAPAAQVSSRIAALKPTSGLIFLQVKDRPCYMNSLMTESFFTMYVRAVLLVRWDADKL